MDIDNQLFKVLKALWRTSSSMAEADQIIDPLVWWISTGRASGTDCRAFCSMSAHKLNHLADLLRANYGSHDSAIAAASKYIRAQIAE